MARKIVIVNQDLFDYFCLGDILFISKNLSLQEQLNAAASVIIGEAGLCQ